MASPRSHHASLNSRPFYNYHEWPALHSHQGFPTKGLLGVIGLLYFSCKSHTQLFLMWFRTKCLHKCEGWCIVAINMKHRPCVFLSAVVITLENRPQLRRNGKFYEKVARKVMQWTDSMHWHILRNCFVYARLNTHHSYSTRVTYFDKLSSQTPIVHKSKVQTSKVQTTKEQTSKEQTSKVQTSKVQTTEEQTPKVQTSKVQTSKVPTWACLWNSMTSPGST